MAVSLGAESPTVFFNRAMLEFMEVVRYTPTQKDYVYIPMTAIRDMRQVIDNSPPCADTYYIAAHLLGFAAKGDVGYIDLCLKYARETVERGNRIHEGNLAFDAVRSINEFQEIIKLPHTKPPGTRIDPLIDPIDEELPSATGAV